MPTGRKTPTQPTNPHTHPHTHTHRHTPTYIHTRIHTYTHTHIHTHTHTFTGADPGFRRGGGSYIQKGGGGVRTGISGEDPNCCRALGKSTSKKKLQTALGGGSDDPPPPNNLYPCMIHTHTHTGPKSRPCPSRLGTFC